MSNPYAAYDVDKSLEQSGIYIEFDTFRVKVKRVGGSNEAFSDLYEQKMKPYNATIRAGKTLPDGVAEQIIAECHARESIIAWETRDGEKWKPGVADESGKIGPDNYESRVKILAKYPQIAKTITDDASDYALFIRKENEEQAKN